MRLSRLAVVALAPLLSTSCSFASWQGSSASDDPGTPASAPSPAPAQPAPPAASSEQGPISLTGGWGPQSASSFVSSSGSSSGSSSSSSSGSSSASEPTPLDTKWCDDPTYAGVALVEAVRGPLHLRYFPGTDAEHDLDDIATKRLERYQTISSFLGLASAPDVTISLSPNRLAAKAHGLAAGTSWPAQNRIEVLYLPGDGAYEKVSYGHELTHVLAQKVDGASYRLDFVSEGLAEYFDGSGRDLHQVYADAIRVGGASGYLAHIPDSDVDNPNYARAGSFVKLVIDRFGPERFVELWRDCAVTWETSSASPSGWVAITALGDRIITGADMEIALGHALQEIDGVDFEGLRVEWEAELSKRLVVPVATPSDADRAQIANVIANVDWAKTHGSASVFRSTLEGFYCDWVSDDARAQLSAAATTDRGEILDDVIATYATGTKNYPTAIVFAQRTERSGGASTPSNVTFWLERFPIGWRITQATPY